MDYKKLSNQSLDEIMQEIRKINSHLNQEKKETTLSQTDAPPKIDLFVPLAFNDLDVYLEHAAKGKQIGLSQAPMYQKKGIALFFSRIVEKIFLRIAQLITRDIREFNANISAAVYSIKRKLITIGDNIAIIQQRVEAGNDKLLIIESNDKALNTKIMQLENSLNQLKVNVNENKDGLQTLQKEISHEIEFHEKFDLFISQTSAAISELEQHCTVILEQFNQTKSAIILEIDAKRKEETEKVIQATIQENEEKNQKKITSLVNELNQNRILIREINETLIELKAIVKWANNQEFTETVAQKAGPNTLDNMVFYHDFEEKFRGTREDIKERLRLYIPKIKEVLHNFTDKRFVDIGCGRGEMLDLLKEQGAQYCVGVDLNEIQLNICKDYGHDVVKQDCIEYLHSLPSESIDMVSGIQIIEHLPMDTLFLLFSECKRVLKKDGVILFETPNNANLITGTTYFYSDPTHIKPLFKDVIKFIVERTGFTAEIIEANPARYSQQLMKPISLDGNQEIWNQNINLLNELLYGPQDYSILGVKL